MKIQVLVGMIGSGKSTYSKNAALSGVICVNDDSIVSMLHAGVYTLYDKKLKLLYKTCENNVIGTALAMNRIVLVDRGLNLNPKGRKRWLALADSFDLPCEAIVFKNDGPEAHARRRTDSDSRGHPYEYWLRVATVHNEKYQEPTLEEGFSDVHRISFEDIQQGRVIL